MPSALRIVDELSELADVTLASLADNNVLIYDSTTSKWVNGTAASIPLTITSIPKTSDYTATSIDKVILCDASSTDITITLPIAANSTGQDFFIKKIDSSEHAVNIDGNENETIDEADIIIMLTQNETIHVVCDGAEWRII